MGWALWLTGGTGSTSSALARAVAAQLQARGEQVEVIERDRVAHVLAPRPPSTDTGRDVVDRALVYVAAILADAGVAVIVDAPGPPRAWRELARAAIPSVAEVRVREGRSGDGAEVGDGGPGAPELIVDTATTSVTDAAADVADLVRRLLRPARRGPPAPQGLGDIELRRLAGLHDDDPEEQAIAGRASLHAARLLSEVAARDHRAAARYAQAREEMVERQIAGRDVRDPVVLGALRRVRREAFVPRHLARRAYADQPLPIGEGQTISQPYVVALMTEAARLRPGDRVLEIGTGSGYGAAVLAEDAAEGYTVERLAGLAESARRRLADLHYANVHVRHGDGSLGWAEHAPFDAIVVTAGGPEVPAALLDQLAVGGRLVMPVGPSPMMQQLVRVVRSGATIYDREELGDVAFVPLIGAQGWSEKAARGEREARGEIDEAASAPL